MRPIISTSLALVTALVACGGDINVNPPPSATTAAAGGQSVSSAGGAQTQASAGGGETTSSSSSGGNGPGSSAVSTTGSGGGPSGPPTLTFQVDVGSAYTGPVSVGNSVQGWDMAGKVQLTDPDKDGIYTGSMALTAGTFMEYKFIKGNSGSGTWEDVPLNCGLKTDTYINRTVVMPSKDLTLPVTNFGACPASTASNDCSNAPGRDVPVTVNGAVLSIGNQPIHMKGIAWSPTAKGKGPGSGAGDFDNYASIDVPLIAQAGINVVRTYGPILNRSVLDKLYSEGIYVLNTVFYGYQDTPQSAVNHLCAVKDHPAILAWVVGNEWNYNKLGLNISLEQATDRVAKVAAALSAQDSTRPVSTIYGEIPSSQVYSALSAVDLWGINAYRGAGFGALFSQWKNLSGKPMYLGEYGSDAYDGTKNKVDEASQASIVKSLTQEIYNNTSVKGTGVCAGGVVFSFADEWWKFGGGSWSVHDTQASWQNGAYADPNMNEEWWGLVDIDRNPRQALTTYGQMSPPVP